MYKDSLFHMVFETAIKRINVIRPIFLSLLKVYGSPHPWIFTPKVSSSRDGQRFEEELGKHLGEEKIDVVLNSLSTSVLIEKNNM